MRAYKAWHCNEFQNYCCLCYSCHCAKMGVTSNHWSRALIESIVTTLLQENQEINDSLKEYGVLKARILKWFAIPFSSDPHFVRTLHHDPSVLGGPTRHGSQFHWVRQGCGPYGASLVAQRLKRLLAMQKTWVWFPGWEDPPGEGNGNPLQYSGLE